LLDSDDEVSDIERPNKKQKKEKNTVREKRDDNIAEESNNQNTIRENRMLKKKLTFIVTSLAQRGLIKTDFIDLVEEDNVVELDEVKLCESLKVDNNSNEDNTLTGRNNTNVQHNNSNKRSPYNGYADGEANFGHLGNGIEPDYADSLPKAVPFIQFL